MFQSAFSDILWPGIFPAVGVRDVALTTSPLVLQPVDIPSFSRLALLIKGQQIPFQCICPLDVGSSSGVPASAALPSTPTQQYYAVRTGCRYVVHGDHSHTTLVTAAFTIVICLLSLTICSHFRHNSQELGKLTPTQGAAILVHWPRHHPFLTCKSTHAEPKFNLNNPTHTMPGIPWGQEVRYRIENGRWCSTR